MRIVRSGSIAALVLLACVFTATAQDHPNLLDTSGSPDFRTGSNAR